MTERPTQAHAHDRQVPRVVEDLDEIECWALLAETSVGRVGVVVGGAAEIYPVNYVVDHLLDGSPTIVFRTDPGTKLAGLGRTPSISFEVDDLDMVEHTGWSILVKGRARQVRELPDAHEQDRIQELPVDHWDPGLKRWSIRIEPTEVTGRRIGRPASPVLAALPSVGEWTGREIWIPPIHAGTETR